MLLISDYDIVFQEVPNEVTLSLNLSDCPHSCKGCHSPQLQTKIGKELTTDIFSELLKKYGQHITCICFMGGDRHPETVQEFAKYLHSLGYKVAWYSGDTEKPSCIDLINFDYYKIGPYIEELGSLKSQTTNQRMYKIINAQREDITNVFWNL